MARCRSEPAAFVDTRENGLMSALALAFSIGCVVTLSLTPLVRKACLKGGLVDRPDGHRKLHRHAVALGGGIAICAATLLTLAVLGICNPARRAELSHASVDLLGLCAAACGICVLGVADDAFNLRGRHKLIGQVLCCLILLASGLLIEQVEILGCTIELGLLSAPFTLLWLLAAINAINLLDGINGLAAAIGVINCAALAVMAHVGHRHGHAFVAATFAGSLLGFLRYNFPRASVFLGDAGSMVIGLVIGVISIQTSLKGPGTVLLAAPVCLWVIPFFDSIAAIVRRKLTGRSIFSTDRGHLHHRLTERVGSVRATVIVALGCLVTAAAALASVNWRNERVALVCGAALIVIFVATRMFGHSELRLIVTRLSSLGRSLLVVRRRQEQVATEACVRLQGGREWEQLWSSLTEYAEQAPLEQIELDVNAPSLREGYHAAWKRRTNHRDERLWRFEMPLIAVGCQVGHIRVMGQRAAESGARNLEKLVELLDSIEEQLAAVVGTAHVPADAGGDANLEWEHDDHPTAHAEFEAARS
jgi:UDP-GlcNAc:undecaprenyl-phosphate GlcNAc-1-phosphate transferase